MSSRSAMRAPTMGNSRLKSSPLRPAASKAGLKKPALALVPAATPAPPIAMERGSKVPNDTAPASCATNSIIGRPNSNTLLYMMFLIRNFDLAVGARPLGAAPRLLLSTRAEGAFRNQLIEESCDAELGNNRRRRLSCLEIRQMGLENVVMGC